MSSTVPVENRSDAGVEFRPLRGTVAVVMTVHNGLPYLHEAIDSILNQSLTHFQFIIVDDGSTDDTASRLDSIQDPRVKILHQRRSGQQAAAHLGILETTATYIARMDSDDVAHPERLMRQAQFLDRNPDVGLVGSQITRRGETGSGLESHFPTDHESIVDDLFHNRHSMCNPATMFRRDLYVACGGYWEHNIAEDWDLFLKIAERAKLANLNEPLLSYRFHRGSINGRRIYDAQLYNEYAASCAIRRKANLTYEGFDAFLARHRSQRFPTSFFFRLDCLSVAQYRIAVSDMHSGRRVSGIVRAAFAICCSPSRTIRRVRGYLASKLQSD